MFPTIKEKFEYTSPNEPISVAVVQRICVRFVQMKIIMEKITKIGDTFDLKVSFEKNLTTLTFPVDICLFY